MERNPTVFTPIESIHQQLNFILHGFFVSVLQHQAHNLYNLLLRRKTYVGNSDITIAIEVKSAKGLLHTEILPSD